MELTHYSDSLLSILPPLVAVTLAVLTRRVLLSLGLGILIGALLVTRGNPLDTVQYLGLKLMAIFREAGAPNWASINILLFLVLLGCLIAWKNWIDARAAARQERATPQPVAAGGCH